MCEGGSGVVGVGGVGKPSTNYSNLSFRVRLMPIAASAGGIRVIGNISIWLYNLLCKRHPHDGLNQYIIS